MRTQSIAVGYLFAAMTGVGAALQQPQSVPPPPPKTPEVALHVGRVRVVREHLEVRPDPVLLPNDEPAPRMILDVIADLGPKEYVAGVASVRAASATDSSGKDLVGPFIRNAGDPLRALQNTVGPNDHTRSIRWVLAIPEKDATTVSANLSVTLRVHAGVERIELKDAPEWTPLTLPSGETIEYRMAPLQNSIEGTGVAFRPPAVQDHIYRVDPRNTPAGLPTLPTDHSKDSITYRIDRDPSPRRPVSITVFLNERVVTGELNAKDISLP